MSTTSQAGIVSAIIGNILLNLALNLQKRAKLRLVRMAMYGIHAPSRNDYQKLLAITLMVVGQFSNFVAYGLAPASIVSPLGVLAVISNCVIPPLLFDETPSIHNITGTTIALPGILMLIMSAPYCQDELVYPLEPGSRLYLGVLCAIAVASCLVRSTVKGPDTRLHTDSLLSSLMGSFCVLSIKCVSAILHETSGGGGLGSRSECGGLLLVLAVVIPVSAILQLTIMVQIVAIYPVWVVVPRLFVFLTVFVGLGSAIVFHEFRDSGVGAQLEFFAGCVLVIIGVLISAKPHSQPNTGITVKRPSALGGPKGRRARHKRNKQQRQHDQHNQNGSGHDAHRSGHNAHNERTKRHRRRHNAHNRDRSRQRNGHRNHLDKGFDPVYPAPRHRHHHHRPDGTIFEPFQQSILSYSSTPLPLAMHSNLNFDPVSRSVPLHEREYLVPMRPRSQHSLPESHASAARPPTETTMLLVPRRYSGEWVDEP